LKPRWAAAGASAWKLLEVVLRDEVERGRVAFRFGRYVLRLEAFAPELLAA
jgi:hypothetical protein